MARKSSLKNITFSADAHLLDEARKIAEEKHTTLNEVFRDWLAQFVRPVASVNEYDALMKKFSHVRPGRKFSREEMNER